MVLRQPRLSVDSALHEDSCLYVVPGSHQHPRGDAQQALSLTSEPPQNPLDMPGSLQVDLKRTPHSPTGAQLMRFVQLVKRFSTIRTFSIARRIIQERRGQRCTHAWVKPLEARPELVISFSMAWIG